MMAIDGNKRLLVLSSPSGGGKSTVARYLLKNFEKLQFSISATTRERRPAETYGIEYFFLEKEDFEKRIAAGEFAEHEEIYGNYYGTLKSEIDKSIICGENLLFDIDVKGALSIKKAYPGESLLVFIAPPSIEELEARLRKRSTETDEQIAKRMERVKMEMEYKDKFDMVVINSDLDQTLGEMHKIVEDNMA